MEDRFIITNQAAVIVEIENITFHAKRWSWPPDCDVWLFPSNKRGVTSLDLGPKFRQTDSFFLVEARIFSVGFHAQVDVHSVM
jgi:hypothetical protein